MFYHKKPLYKDADWYGKFSEKMGKAREWLKNWQQRTNNLIICSGAGTGKTYLFHAFLNALAAKAKYFPSDELGGEFWFLDGVEYVNAKDMFSTIKQSFGQREYEAQEAVCKWTQARLLIIDDLGVGYGTDSEIIELTDLIDRRHEEQLPTVIATNMTMDGLAQYLKERAGDRLFDGADYVEIKTKSQRKKPKEL